MSIDDVNTQLQQLRNQIEAVKTRIDDLTAELQAERTARHTEIDGIRQAFFPMTLYALMEYTFAVRFGQHYATFKKKSEICRLIGFMIEYLLTGGQAHYECPGLTAIHRTRRSVAVKRACQAAITFVNCVGAEYMQHWPPNRNASAHNGGFLQAFFQNATVLAETHNLQQGGLPVMGEAVVNNMVRTINVSLHDDNINSRATWGLHVDQLNRALNSLRGITTSNLDDLKNILRARFFVF